MMSDIDIVITWVDNHDPLWRKKLIKYAKTEPAKIRFESRTSWVVYPVSVYMSF